MLFRWVRVVGAGRSLKINFGAAYYNLGKCLLQLTPLTSGAYAERAGAGSHRDWRKEQRNPP